MKLKGLFAAVISALGIGICSYAQGEIVITYDSRVLSFSELPIIRNDKTLVQLRPIAEAMELNIEYIDETGQVILSNSDTKVVFTNDSDIISVNGTESVMIAPVCNHNDYTFVPIRDLAEPFGKIVSYDGTTKAVNISSAEKEEFEEAAPEENADDEIPLEQSGSEYWYSQDAYAGGMILRPGANELLPARDVSSGSGLYDSYYYYQSQPDMELENHGRGYCWVCSYAMLISNVTGEKVTPIDVANVNIENGYSGSFMFHSAIMNRYDCEFVPALSEDSAYFGGYNEKKKGDTVIIADNDEAVISAIKEALLLHPCGVLVRYEGYPHTMLAVGVEDNVIYFNDPGIANAEHVTFAETCLSNYKLSDISFIQAIVPVEGK